MNKKFNMFFQQRMVLLSVCKFLILYLYSQINEQVLLNSVKHLEGEIFFGQ